MLAVVVAGLALAAARVSPGAEAGATGARVGLDDPPLEAFGQGPAVVGVRPLLVILVETEVKFVRPARTIEKLRTFLFGGPGSRPLVGPAGVLNDISGGRFAFREARIVGPVPNPDDPETPGDESKHDCAFGFLRNPEGEPLLCSGTDRQVLGNAIAAAAKRFFPFAEYDTNRDGNVSSDELAILVVGAASPGGGFVQILDRNFPGERFRLWRTPADGRRPLHRWLSRWHGDVFETTAWVPSETGEVREGTYEHEDRVGYVAAEAAPGLIRLDLFYSPSRHDYFAKLQSDPPTGDTDYRFVRTEGWVLPPGRLDDAMLAASSAGQGAADSAVGGANRPSDPGCVQTPPVQVCTVAAGVGDGASARTILHELIHLLGVPWEAYGTACNSLNFTLMSCTVERRRDLRETVDLDPYAKLRLGWLQPRVLSTRATGCFDLSPAGGRSAPGTQAILLYDPRRGTDDLILLEYRTPERERHPDGDPLGSGRRFLPDTGVAIWTVRKDANGIPVAVPRGAGQTESAVYLLPPRGTRGQPVDGDGLWDASNRLTQPSWATGGGSGTIVRVLSVEPSRARIALGVRRPACAGPEPPRTVPGVTLAGAGTGTRCLLQSRQRVCTIETPAFVARSRFPGTIVPGRMVRIQWEIEPKRVLTGRIVFEIPQRAGRVPTAARVTAAAKGRKRLTVSLEIVVGDRGGLIPLATTIRYQPVRGGSTVRRLALPAFVPTPVLAHDAVWPVVEPPPARPPAPPPTTTTDPSPPPPPPPPPAKPDLVVSQLAKTAWEVRNQGSAAAGAFTVRVVVGGQPIGQTVVKGLDPGAAATGTFPCVVGTVTATVDALGEVDEADETNNSQSLTNVKCP